MQSIVSDNSAFLPSNPSNSGCQRIDRQAREPSQDISSLDLDSPEPDRQLRVCESAERFIRKSKKERKAFVPGVTTPIQ